MESKKAPKPEFTTDFPEAAIRQGAGELIVRADEGALRTFNDTTDMGDSRCRPRLVDKDWHAVCQAIFQGVEGSEWKIMYCNDKELHEALSSPARTKCCNEVWRRFIMSLSQIAQSPDVFFSVHAF